jgi:hypothetical protein
MNRDTQRQPLAVTGLIRANWPAATCFVIFEPMVAS